MEYVVVALYFLATEALVYLTFDIWYQSVGGDLSYRGAMGRSRDNVRPFESGHALIRWAMVHPPYAGDWTEPRTPCCGEYVSNFQNLCDGCGQYVEWGNEPNDNAFGYVLDDMPHAPHKEGRRCFECFPTTLGELAYDPVYAQGDNNRPFGQ